MRKRNPKLTASSVTEIGPVLRIWSHQGDCRLECLLLFSASAALLPREAEGQEVANKGSFSKERRWKDYTANMHRQTLEILRVRFQTNAMKQIITIMQITHILCFPSAYTSCVHTIVLSNKHLIAQCLKTNVHTLKNYLISKKCHHWSLQLVVICLRLGGGCLTSTL